MTPLLEERPKADALPFASGGSALFDGHYAPPPRDEDGKIWVRTSVIIQSHPRKLYEMWIDVEAAPAWHERIVEVIKTGPRTARWIMRHEDGKELQWEFETLNEEPGKRISWRSIGGEPESAGEVIFEPAPGSRGTMVTLRQQFRMGKVARLWETITGRDPKQSAIENLRHFKAMAETGEIPRTALQPHGDRGIAGNMKRSLYGEKIATPNPSVIAEK